MKGTPQNKQKARDYRADWYARNVQCVLEPIHTVWRPLDGTTAFDTEERICGACWLVEDDRGAGRGDTEDPWELQRLHDAWLEKEFFFKKKNNGAKKMPVKGCPDCGKLLTNHSMRRHRRFYCKSRQPVALDSVRQGRPAEKDAVLEPPPPPEAPLDADGGALGDDRRAALMQVGRMLEEDDAYLGVIWLPHGQPGRRARSEAVASNPY